MENIPRKTAVEKCVKALKDARNDNEKMAALLLVTRIAKVKELDTCSTKQIYEAVGFEFINRLLKTKSIPEGCLPSAYLSLGLTVLACFSSNPELAMHAHMTDKIHIFLDIILNRYDNFSIEKDEDIQSLKEDCYTILFSISSSPGGCSILASNGAIKDLIAFVGDNIQASKQAIQLLATLLQAVPDQVHHATDVARILSILAKNFGQSQTESKFTFCNMLVDLLSCSNELFLHDEQMWNSFKNNLKLVRKGLMDILQSKVTDYHKAQAIILASAIIDLYGIEWTLTKYVDEEAIYSEKFVLLLVSLISVEMNTFYDSQELINLPCVISCFNVIEKVIIHLCNNNQLNPFNKMEHAESISSIMLLKLHSALTDCIFGIIQFLIDTSKEINQSHSIDNIMIIGSVRTLCAWMSEETLALKDDVAKVIPFLFMLGKESFENITRNIEKTAPSLTPCPNFLHFLLPVLCHLSADDGSREIMLKEEFHITLQKYFVYLLDLIKKDNHSDLIYRAVETLLGIFLNLAVTEKDVAANDPSFHKIRLICYSEIQTMMKQAKQVVLLANMITLTLILTRAQCETVSALDNFNHFFIASLQFLADVCPLNKDTSSPEWDDISELWLIGVDNLTACIPVIPGLARLLRQSKQFALLHEFIQNKDVNLQEGSSMEIIVSLRSLLENIYHGK